MILQEPWERTTYLKMEKLMAKAGYLGENYFMKYREIVSLGTY